MRLPSAARLSNNEVFDGFKQHLKDQPFVAL